MTLPPPLIRVRSSAVPPTATAQHKGVFVRDGKPVFFTRGDVRKAEADWWQILEPHRPKTPLDGPLYIRVCLAWPYLKTDPKRLVKAKALIPVHTRPDMDNLLKALLDIVHRVGLISDDARLALIIASKIRCEHSGVSIDIGALPDSFDGWTPAEQLELPLFPDNNKNG